MKLNSLKAFTLTEVLVSILIIGIASVFSWKAVSVLNPTSEASNNRVKAENLITKSQEQLYQASQTQFDNLENCTFLPANPCGFEDITNSFPGFTRTLNFVSQGTSELKGARVTVTWQERGAPQSLDSMMLLARPRENVPGNLIGKVTKSTDNTLLGGVTITISNLNTSEVSTATSSTTILPRGDGLQTNYNYSNPGTGRFLLNPGTWRLTASKQGYISSSPHDVVIDSNQEQVYDFQLTPLPANATINVQLVDQNTNSPVSFNTSSYVGLYEAGVYRDSFSNRSSFQFSIGFLNNDPRSFTIATNNAFMSRLAGTLNCGYPWTYLGWSSAVVNGSGAVNCGNMGVWNGIRSLDRFTVSPGENISVNIPLVPVPTATLQGVVYDLNHNPIAGANIYVSWHTGTTWQNSPQGTTTSTGQYSVTVPAEQSMFSNFLGYYIQVTAQTTGPYVNCCNQPGTSNRYSDTLRIGPIFSGDVITRDFTINTSTQSQDCGNAQGNIVDASSGAPVNNSFIQMSSVVSNVAGDGSFRYQCNDSAYFRLPVGSTNIYIQSDPPTRYYPYLSTGNDYYTFRPNVNITRNSVLTVPTISIWPRGTGIVRGTLRNADTNIPVSNTLVRLYLSGTVSNSMTVLTDTNGVFYIPDVVETWPPPALLGNPGYIQTFRKHRILVPETAIYEQYSGEEFTLNNGETKNFEINLIPRGAV